MKTALFVGADSDGDRSLNSWHRNPGNRAKDNYQVDHPCLCCEAVADHREGHY